MIRSVRVLVSVLTLAAGAGAANAEPIAPPFPSAAAAPLEIDRPFEGPPELVFISPAGEPFRTPVGSPYPVAVWFARADTNGDGALTADEFAADALSFFDRLDTDKDGRVDGFENVEYEKTVAPEILGVMRRPEQPRSGAKGGWGPFSRADAMWGRSPILAPGTSKGRGPRQRTGAGQYGLLNEPHPVRGGDADIDGKVSRREAEDAARRRFKLLDLDGDGRLTLDTLPVTPAQAAFEVPPSAPERRKR